MSVLANRPEIHVLRQRVEETFGQSLATHNAFLALVDAIGAKLREHISESTLERLWGYSTRDTDAVSLRTLDVLARYVGFDSWKAFCTDLKVSSPVESEEFNGESIVASVLEIGKRLQLGWLPDRQIVLEYLGNNRFVVRESQNSSLKPGDSFECLQFQVGRPLYLDRFRRADSLSETRYVAGERNGLTSALVL